MLHRAARESIQSLLLVVALAVLALATPCVQAATVSFQGRDYSVTSIALSNTVLANVPSNGELIFFSQSGKKLLALVTSPFRGDYDFANHRFYMMVRNPGESGAQITAYSSIDANLINLDGTFFDVSQQSPAFGQTALETITRPLTIPSTEIGLDLAIINSSTLVYRTDGALTTDEKVYTINRASPADNLEQFAIPLKNADSNNDPARASIVFDPATAQVVLFQANLDATVNTDTRNRLSAFNETGTLTSQLILDNNSAFPNFSGAATAIAIDPETSTIYMFDPASTVGALLFVIAPIPPAVQGLTPTTGSIAGGTKVTLTGTSLPADAAVTFGGVAATGVTVAANGNSITVTTPAHAPGVVDVAITGTGISSTAPLTLAAAYSYVNNAPDATLSASPTTGSSAPLIVGFTVGAADSDGSIVTRTIDFGDNSSFTFTSDLNGTTVSHTYTAQGVYHAILTVTDNLGASSTDVRTIVVGATTLVMRSLAFNVTDTGNDPPGFPNSKDTLKLTSEIILPDGADVANNELTIGFVNVSGDISNDLLGPFPTDTSIAAIYQPAVNGAQFSAKIDGNRKINYSVAKFSIKALRRPGTAANTFTINFTGSGFKLRSALEQAGVLVPKGSEKTQPSVASVRIIVRLKSPAGQTLQYTHVSVVQVKTGKSAMVKLTRN